MPVLLAWPLPAAWLQFWSVFGVLLIGLVMLGWLWRMAWARLDRRAPCPGIYRRGRRDVVRRVVILAGVFVISAALTFAP